MAGHPLQEQRPNWNCHLQDQQRAHTNGTERGEDDNGERWPQTMIIATLKTSNILSEESSHNSCFLNLIPFCFDLFPVSDACAAQEDPRYRSWRPALWGHLLKVRIMICSRLQNHILVKSLLKRFENIFFQTKIIHLPQSINLSVLISAIKTWNKLANCEMICGLFWARTQDNLFHKCCKAQIFRNNFAVKLC